MKVCICQTDTVWENKAENMLKCERMLSHAAESGAGLAVFPELTLTGFTMNASLAEPRDGETVSFFRELSKKYGIAVIFGYALAERGRVYNNLALVSGGDVAAEYSKLHPFTYGGESEVYTRGDRICSAALSEFNIGLTVCYDLRFPELFQRLSGGCGCIVVSANWAARRRDHWIALLKARAIENQCYIIGCNRCGSGGGIDYSGDSTVISPEGSVLAAVGSAEQNIYADIGIEAVQKLRESFPIKKDRRTDLYRSFYE